MTPQERQRFEFLRSGPCVPTQYVHDFYGIEWPLRGELLEDYGAFQKQRHRRQECPKNMICRYELEKFMQMKRIVPKRWMGARLGMAEDSVESLLATLPKIGLRSQRYVVYPKLISESLPEDLVANLPGLRFRTFYDHNSYCERLHAELKETLGIEIQTLFCATSDRMQDDPRQFAMHFDCLTLAPLSGKHQLWLDFRKSLNLGPDRCSKLFYVENHNDLRPFCAGTREPEDLDVYEQFLAGAPSV